MTCPDCQADLIEIDGHPACSVCGRIFYEAEAMFLLAQVISKYEQEAWLKRSRTIQ